MQIFIIVRLQAQQGNSNILLKVDQEVVVVIVDQTKDKIEEKTMALHLLKQKENQETFINLLTIKDLLKDIIIIEKRVALLQKKMSYVEEKMMVSLETEEMMTIIPVTLVKENLKDMKEDSNSINQEEVTNKVDTKENIIVIDKMIIKIIWEEIEDGIIEEIIMIGEVDIEVDKVIDNKDMEVEVIIVGEEV